MNNFLLSLLIDPSTGNKLNYNKDTNSLVDDTFQKSYQIIDNIPVILDYTENTSLEKSKIHKDFASDFSYLDHYQKDAEIFNYFKDHADYLIEFENKKLHDAIIAAVPLSSQIILDVGCGNGWLSKELIPKGKKVISMDISTKNPINAIKNINVENHAGLVADVYRIPIKKQSINCIIASEIIEHVTDPKVFISNLIDLLAPNGKLVISTPYNENIKYSLCVHCNRPTPHYAHLHSFNERNITNYFPSQDFKWSFKKLNNRFLIKSRIYILLKIFPNFVWRFTDRVMNKINNKAERLVIEVTRI